MPDAFLAILSQRPGDDAPLVESHVSKDVGSGKSRISRSFAGVTADAGAGAADTRFVAFDGLAIFGAGSAEPSEDDAAADARVSVLVDRRSDILVVF